MEKSKYVKLVSGKITGNSHVSISRVEGKSFTLKIAEGEKDFVDIQLLNEIKSQIDNPTQQYNPQFISVTPLSSYAKDGRKYMKIKISSDSTRIYLHFVDYSLAKKVYELFNEKVLEIEKRAALNIIPKMTSKQLNEMQENFEESVRENLDERGFVVFETDDSKAMLVKMPKEDRKIISTFEC